MMRILRPLAAAISIAALAVCLIAPLRVLLGEPSGEPEADFAAYLRWFNGASLVWFLAAPLWLFGGRRPGGGETAAGSAAGKRPAAGG